jgi:uncharacterized RDD family membrane protein YckC
MTQADEYQYHSIWTPEMVELNLPLAGVARRCIAMFIDQVIIGLFLIAAWIGFTILIAALAPKFGNLSSQMGAGLFAGVVIVMILFTALAHILYFWGFPTFHNGQTLGKEWVRIQVVTDRGGRASGLTHLIRSIFTLLDILLLYGSVGVLMILMSKREKRIADYAAGTMVVILPEK